MWKKLQDLNISLTETKLCKLGKMHKTDKPGNGYTKVYYEIMKDFRDEPVNIFEIGIYFGASIKMWEEFFPKGKICGIDNGRIVPNSKIVTGNSNEIPSTDDVKLLQLNATVESLNLQWLETDRTKCFVADQRSLNQLMQAFEHFECNSFDVILDDGQHYQEHQQKSLGLLFQNVKPGKFYIIEDVVDHESLTLSKTYWGQRKKDASDSTDSVFSKFIKTGKLESPYITFEQTNYIINNIDDIFMYENCNKNNSPINGTSKLLVIKKKI
jgi:hypothetical protein